AALTNSIKELGLRTPLTVRHDEGPITIDGEEVYSVPVLVAGRHRLEALKMLSEEWVEVVYEDDGIKARLWEIDENLSRAELSTDEKRTLLRKRKELWEEQQKSRGTPRPTFQKSAAGSKGFAAETAE